MNKIEKIYIACSKRDFYFAKLCISSIRYWDIDLPIELIVDHAWGDINTTYLQKYWGVKRFDTPFKIFKESYSKLEPLFENTGKRILIIDCDIVLLGNMIADLEKIESDIICQKIYYTEEDKELNTWWFNIDKLKQWDTDYRYPGYVFYAGQLVTYEGIFSRKDFTNVLEFGNPPKLKHVDIFLNNADQGILNYIVEKKTTNKKITIDDYTFFIGRYDSASLKLIKIDNILSKKEYPKMIHYYGPKNGLLVGLPAENILRFYDKHYYKYYKNPGLIYNIDRLLRTIKHPITFAKELAKKNYKHIFR